MYRIGQSIDIHQLVANRKLILGGVEIDFEYGLLGHSDADVLCHAIIESIIGALGLGDIGKHFSDTDEQYKGISSLILLEKTYEMMSAHGYEINNLDAIIIIEKPKMAPHIQKMKENISNILITNSFLFVVSINYVSKLFFYFIKSFFCFCFKSSCNIWTSVTSSH